MLKEGSRVKGDLAGVLELPEEGPEEGISTRVIYSYIFIY